MYPKCCARRDWMVSCDVPGRVFLCRRCAHQWHEPELTRGDFDAMVADPLAGSSLLDASDAGGGG